MKTFTMLLLDFALFSLMFGFGVWFLLFQIVPQYVEKFPTSKISDIASIFHLRKGMFLAIFCVGFTLWLACYAFGTTGYLVSAGCLGLAFFIVKFLANKAGVGFEESVEDEKKRKEKEFEKYYG